MVAGAYKADLLADFRSAVQKSIDGQLSLKQFREQFDQIVAKHGWSYNGGRNWRSELIWDTNITSAYQAGRWQQFEASGTEYLTYVHADGVAHPRPLHVSWSGTTLPITDPWWDSHYPPCAWHCHCRAVRADRSDFAEAAKGGKGTAPQDGTKEWTNKVTGETKDYPNGIDPGFGYNVGKAAGRDYRVLSDKFDTLPRDISRAWMKEHLGGPAFARFARGRIEGEFPVAVLTEEAQKALSLDRQTIWIDRSRLDETMGIEDYRMITRIVNEGRRGKSIQFKWDHEGLQYHLRLKGNRVESFRKAKS
nr:phage minor head protein [Geomonas sp. Red32]